MVNNRIIITVTDNISDQTAIESVLAVVKAGKISNTKGKDQYCFATTITNGTVVYARCKYNLKSDSFIVSKDNNHGIKNWSDKNEND